MGVLRRSTIDALQPKFEEIGRLYKGSPKQKKKNKKGEEYLGYGDDLDYFRFEASDRLRLLPSNTHFNLKEEVEAKWAAMEQITSGWRSIPILLPYRSIESNFVWRNAVYDASGRTTRSCNGEICDRQPFEKTTVDGKRVKTVIRGCYKCAMGPDDDKCPAGCKAEGKLFMIIPGLYPGLVILTTRSLIDIQTIKANLQGYSRFDLSRIPLRLCRSLRDASYTNEQGEYKDQKKWLLHIEIDPQYGQLALDAQQQQYKAELMGSARQYLPEQRRSLPSAPIEEVETEYFLPKAESVKLWNYAKENGYSQDDAKKVLANHGIDSFNEIPADAYTMLLNEFSRQNPIEASPVVQAEVV